MMILSISFDFNYVPLLIVMAIAWLIPMFMSFIGLRKVPTVIAEIIAGFFIGKILLSCFPQSSMRTLEFLGLSGFLFLMFESGLGIDINKILDTLPRKKLTYSRFMSNPLLVGLSMFIITLILSYASTLLLDMVISIKNKWYFSLILVTTSVGIIVPVLKNRGEINSRYGQMIILAAAVADVLSIVLFTFTAFTIKNGFEFKLLLILLLFVVFLVFHRIGLRVAKISIFKRLLTELEHATSRIKVRGTILIILIFLVMAQFLGHEVMLLGAFLGGLLLSSFVHRERSVLSLQMEGMGYGFFIPIFFIMVGVQFDPTNLHEFDQSLYLFLGLLILVLYGVKIIPAFFWQRLFGKRKAVSGGILMASRLSLIIAASKIGLDMDIISPGINACFIIMAVVTCLLSPVLYNYLNPQNIFKNQKCVIVGGGSTAVLLSRRLDMHNRQSIIIENDEKRFKEILRKGLNAIYGDGKYIAPYNEVNLKPFDHVVVLTPDNNANLEICKLLKEYFRHDKIITKSDSLKIEQKLHSLEVNTVDTVRTIASTIENFIIRPNTYQALNESFENFIIEETRISNKELDGTEVQNIPFPKDAYLMLVKKGDKMQVPHGDTCLKQGDTVIVFGTRSAMEQVKQRFTNPS